MKTLDSIEGGTIFSVVQEGSRQHSGVGDNIQEGGFGPGQRVGEEGVSDSTFVIKEQSQAIETARTEVRQGLRRKGK